MDGITVGLATTADLDDLLALWAADAAESGRGAQAVAADDFLAGDGFWVLLARVDDEPAGVAHVCRIPKADARRGFLFVDELFVHPAHRRKGVATALLDRVAAMGRELGLAGVRLLVRPENAAARALYMKAGFQEYPTILCQREVRRSP
ncbi:MAG: GNAT family N-acetyltransferase [Anaerolineae bacterium]|jgi:ribosomal protein S18 acetylase RimI-like enzyme|nr:GNAT family N-acetyltransferase [Anaerolineae bacterium]